MKTELLPVVLKKNNQSEPLNPEKVYNSLIKETDITEENARFIRDELSRFLISSNIKHLTAPLIREITNTLLLKHDLEVERLQYTRIGLPVFDLIQLYNDHSKVKIRKTEILNWVVREFSEVLELINQLRRERRREREELKSLEGTVAKGEGTEEDVQMILYIRAKYYKINTRGIAFRNKKATKPFKEYLQKNNLQKVVEYIEEKESEIR